MLFNIEGAFLAMRDFLENYYYASKSSTIGCILGDTMYFGNGETADPAAWSDWEDSVVVVIDTLDNDRKLNPYLGYLVMMDYLRSYGQRIKSTEIPQLLEDMEMVNEKASRNSKYWILWNECLEGIKH